MDSSTMDRDSSVSYITTLTTAGAAVPAKRTAVTSTETD
jgi:hypothetical protein